MSTRARQYDATVLRREQVSDHLVRLTLGGAGLADFTSTGIPDEWVGLVVPGQFQSRYYTVRSWSGGELVLDVVVHEVGLVTEWAARDVVGEQVAITEPRGSFAMPSGAQWLLLVGDLTAMPAMARIASEVGLDRLDQRSIRIWAEVPDDLTGYLPDGPDVTWLAPPAEGASDLAAAVEAIDWPAGEGYFWMAGESAQMRAIRKHLMRDRKLPSTAYDVMGYWRGGATRQPRAVDPGPIYRAGKAAGKTDDQIWADYDRANES
ncbi:siderophore-interacting protein [Nocardioides sp. LS1]|uniref:siderophore-interacting protein n=1 Tax=Nocardioides sp. LS1 TaxID=1027620 RepID=UPI000F61B9EE|nr:siderophore-interacting protein [Nocardioides sp. LS1]GCD88455.1 siderophore-interacting protein [Nocardioides sp. LS1]